MLEHRMADKKITHSRTPHNDLTAEYVRSILNYDPETGLFRWRWRNDAPTHWNARWAGCHTAKDPKSRYHRIKINGHRYPAHHLAWLWMTGTWAADEIDHRDRNTMNNCWRNLREATRAQNRHNNSKSARNKTGYTGVEFCEDCPRKPWRSVIHHLGKKTELGLFYTAAEAGAAYQEAQKRLRGEFIHD
jgi:hypothetical protein